MSLSLRTSLVSIAVLSSSLALAETPPAAPSSGPRILDTTGDRQTNKVSLEVGQDRLLDLSFPLRGMSIPNPDVADVKLLSSNTQVLVSAKGVGDTYITLLDKNQVPLVLAVHVTRNLDALRKQIKELFPDESITVTAAGDLVVLSGEVSDLRVPERMAEVARLHSPKLANLLHVRGNQQVQLEVKFAEVTRTGLREMGLTAFHDNGSRIGGYSAPTNPVTLGNSSPPAVGGTFPKPAIPLPFGDAFSLFFSGFSQFPFSAVVSMLEENDLAKTLAEPTLVAMTGQEASFLAGGEIPIVISTGFGAFGVQWKKFGIQLKFMPTVLADGLINLHMQTEVSQINRDLGIQLNGFAIPGIDSRQSETTVRMHDGQSFAVAGLLSDKVRSAVGKIPLLGEIPILGALFRSTRFQREESELLVVITARLAKPVAPHDAPLLPGHDELNDPDDFELFLIGKVGHKANVPAVRGQAIPVVGETGGPSGDIGYIR